MDLVSKNMMVAHSYPYVGTDNPSPRCSAYRLVVFVTHRLTPSLASDDGLYNIRKVPDVKVMHHRTATHSGKTFTRLFSMLQHQR
jgi:hypothetical protein